MSQILLTSLSMSKSSLCDDLDIGREVKNLFVIEKIP